jgi:hypothetical protein
MVQTLPGLRSSYIPDRPGPQNDRPAACVIAQQYSYSSSTFSSTRFSLPELKKKSGARLKMLFLKF